MTDPRWQRAMERLGLWPIGHQCTSMGISGRCILAPYPDDPATFKLVVEALLREGYWIEFRPNKTVEITSSWGLPTNKPTLYEAVMEAFGK